MGVLLPIIFSFLNDAGYLPEGFSYTPNKTQTYVQMTNALSSIATSSSFEVSKVVDGDTVDLTQGDVTVRVRLIGINSPESVDPRRKVECFGKEASLHAKELLNGKTVTIELDPSQDTYDKYKRLLAYIVLPDGTSFNQKMIEEGYAHEYTYDRPYTYQKIFKSAQVTARDKQLGLWSPQTCDGKK